METGTYKPYIQKFILITKLSYESTGISNVSKSKCSHQNNEDMGKRQAVPNICCEQYRPCLSARCRGIRDQQCLRCLQRLTETTALRLTVIDRLKRNISGVCTHYFVLLCNEISSELVEDGSLVGHFKHFLQHVRCLIHYCGNRSML